MDTNKMREEIENWFMENVDCEDDHFFPRDKARYFTKNLLSLLAPVIEKAEKWDRVEDTHEFKFVRHIESHLSGNQVPICTICGKTIFEIALEGKEG